MKKDFCAQEFRRALGMFPTGVAVITGRGSQGKPIGITVNSFTSVSLDPPLISVNLAKSLASYDSVLNWQSFAINILTKSQSKVSSGFALANSNKWACTETRLSELENPLLDSHLAIFECEKYATHEAGDHLIVLGRVMRFEINDAETPLVFFRGKYREVGDLITE